MKASELRRYIWRLIWAVYAVIFVIMVGLGLVVLVPSWHAHFFEKNEPRFFLTEHSLLKPLFEHEPYLTYHQSYDLRRPNLITSIEHGTNVSGEIGLEYLQNLLSEHPDATFTPLYQETAVIAYAPAYAERIPQSFSDIATLDGKISLTPSLARALVVEGMSVELDQGKTLHHTIQLLSSLHDKDRLLNPSCIDDIGLNLEQAPYALMTDTEVIYLQNHGYDIEYVVPKKGTLTSI